MDTEMEDAGELEDTVDFLLSRIELYCQLAMGARALSGRERDAGELAVARVWLRRGISHERKVIALARKLAAVTAP